MPEELTLKQRIFALEYLRDGNGKRAAIAAGYKPRNAEVAASKMLRLAKVKAEIEKNGKRISVKLEKIEISVEKVAQELAKLAFVDPRDFYRADGTMKEIPEMEAHVAACVAGCEQEEIYDGRGDERHFVGHLRKFKFADKGQNLERLGRHLKMFTDKTEPDSLIREAAKEQAQLDFDDVGCGDRLGDRGLTLVPALHLYFRCHF